MTKRLFTFLPLWLSLFFLETAPATAQPDLNPVSWKSVVTNEDGGNYLLTFTATIESPWHLYDLGPYENGPDPMAFTFEPNAFAKVTGAMEQHGSLTRKYDETFRMEIGSFASQAEFTQRIQLKDSTQGTTLRVNVKWVACNDRSCLPPEDRDFTIAVGPQPEACASIGKTDFETTETGNDKTLWGFIIEAILGALASLFTPCVFPMIPLTVSFFLKGNGDPDKRKGRIKAALYGFFIVALYTVPVALIAIITASVGGDAIHANTLNWISTHWLPNSIFFLVFMVFAASFFGAFEIRLPGKLIHKSDTNADRKGLVGIFFMALTLVLVSFSCTVPIVGTVLIDSTSGMDLWTPVISIFAYSVTFALPFVLLALFPSILQKLPKSGGWLNSVKIVLGFLELALGLKFLSVADQAYHWGILDREVYLALWIVIFTLLGFYLLGKLRFKYDSEIQTLGITRLTLSILVFSFVVYLIPGMWGAPLKAISGYLPPMRTQDYVMDEHGQKSGRQTATGNQMERPPKYSDFLKLPYGLHGYFDFEEATEAAQRAGRPILVDFTGHGCVNCREMEARVWSDPRVLELLYDRFVILALYSDDKKTVPASDWVTAENGKTLKTLGKINAHLARTRFGVNSQPYYVILDSHGNPLGPGRGYDLNIGAYIQFLETNLERFQAVE